MHHESVLGRTDFLVEVLFVPGANPSNSDSSAALNEAFCISKGVSWVNGNAENTSCLTVPSELFGSSGKGLEELTKSVRVAILQFLIELADSAAVKLASFGSLAVHDTCCRSSRGGQGKFSQIDDCLTCVLSLSDRVDCCGFRT